MKEIRGSVGCFSQKWELSVICSRSLAETRPKWVHNLFTLFSGIALKSNYGFNKVWATRAAHISPRQQTACWSWAEGCCCRGKVKYLGFHKTLMNIKITERQIRLMISVFFFFLTNLLKRLKPTVNVSINKYSVFIKAWCISFLCASGLHWCPKTIKTHQWATLLHWVTCYFNSIPQTTSRRHKY